MQSAASQNQMWKLGNTWSYGKQPRIRVIEHSLCE